MESGNLIIIAGGDATRLKSYHHDLIPKILLPLDDETVLLKMLNYWSEFVDEFYIVVKNTIEQSQIRQYLSLINSDYTAKTKIYVIGSEFHTMYKLNEMSKVIKNDKPTFVTWSDIYPTEIDIIKLDVNHIFSDENKLHRFEFDGSKITNAVDSTGNVCGIFYLKSASEISKIYDRAITSECFTEKLLEITDFTVVLQRLLLIERQTTYVDFSNFDKLKCKIIDIGDETKYEKYFESQQMIDFAKTRHFNSIRFSEDSVIKSSFTEAGKNLMYNESMYYEVLKQQSEDIQFIFPKKIEFRSNDNRSDLELSRIKGKTVFEILSLNDPEYQNIDLAKGILFDFEKTIKPLHDEKVYDRYIDRAKTQEYLDVTKSRISSVSSFLHNIDEINGEKINLSDNELENIIKTCLKLTNETIADSPASIIHGDPNTSNVMYDENLKMKFIDPRGTFGNLFIFGDPMYDKAKFLYGLSGYDVFNTASKIDIFTKKSSNGKININYVLPKHYDIDDLTDNVELKFLVSIIWLKLSAYIINHPLKCIVAYCHGITMLKKYSKQLQKTF